jgi:hypothetical protein
VQSELRPRQKADFIRQHGLDPGQFVWDATGPVRRKSSGSWGLVVGLGVGGLALVLFLCIPVGLILLAASRAAARRPSQAVPVQQANNPFPIQDARGLPNSLRDDLERSRQRHDELMQELHRQNERLLEDLRRVPKVEPPDFPVGPLGPAGEDTDPVSDARRQIDELRRKSQERMDQQLNDLRERSRQRQEEMRQRMDELRQRFP